MATMSVSGVVSGMDWDSMIDEIITNAAKPAQVQVSKRTNLTNKKSLFEEMKVTMNSLQSSLTNLKLPSTYKAKELEIERIDTNGSYKGVLTATVNADAEVNVYDLKVNKLARAQTNRSKQITASTVSSALSDQGLTSGTMYINMAGQKVGIDISSTDSLQSIKSKINNTLKTLDIPVEVTASVVDNRLILRSDNTGLGANSLTETLTYGLNGKNTITSFNVNDSDLGTDNFVIRNSKGNKLTYGTDYDVVNGNEIRWNQYEKTDNVKLGNTVTAAYKLAKGDTYESTGTYGTSEASISGLTLNDNGTLSSRLKIQDDDGNTYYYGQDFTLDSSGNVEWLESSDTTDTTENYSTLSKYTAEYVLGSAASFSESVSTSSNYVNLSGTPSLNSMGVDTFSYTDSNGNEYKYVTKEYGDAAFTMTGTDGTTYEYGKHYAIRQSAGSTGSSGFAVVWPNNSRWPEDEFSDTDTSMPTSGLTLSYNDLITKTKSSSGTATISSVLGFTPLNYDYLTIKTDENTYAYTDSPENLDEYSFILVDGVVKIQSETTTSSHPESGVGYTLIYDAYGAIDTEYTYTGESTQEAFITVDSGYGNINGDALSYEQILSDTGLTSSSTDSDFAKYFTLTDSGGKEYTYGTDYRIIKGSDADSASGEYSPLIEWISGGNPPTSGDTFTLSYSGRADDTVDFSVERSYTDAIQSGSSGTSPLYSYFDGGTTTITQGTKTFYEGIDYEIVKSTTTDENGNTITNAAVEWKTGTNSEWYYPGSNSNYTINLTTSSGSSLTYTAIRSPSDSLDLRNYGFTSVNGSISSITYQGSSTHTYDLTSTDKDDDGDTDTDNMSDEIGLEIENSTNGGFRTFNFNWVAPERTANADLPGVGEEFKVEYTYNANTFTLSDDSDGKLLAAFELDQTDSDHYMAAQNAELELDGETITRDSNDIGEAYDNELIKGMTIHLKGVGEVSLDVAHDAEKAVESIQTFVDTYNDLMTWINTRMTESAVDEDTAATIDSDDFRMRWGLLHGNSLLRNTKSKMRSIVSQNFTFSFTQRSSSDEIYGNMSYNGLKNNATLRLRIANKFVDVAILPTDTLQDIVDKINDDSEDGPMHDIYYDDDGNKLQQPLLKASIENDKLVINSTGSDSITMSGTSAMNALKMNYTYRGLYQLGIATTSTDYGKSGELEFDTGTFMEALEDNPDEVQELMLMFANEFDSWTKSMLTTSASGETSGTLTRQIEDLDTQIKTIDEYLEKYQERLDRMEENLKTKYANTETNLAKLTQQANSIAAVLNQLNGYANNNSSSSS